MHFPVFHFPVLHFPFSDIVQIWSCIFRPSISIFSARRCTLPRFYGGISLLLPVVSMPHGRYGSA